MNQAEYQNWLDGLKPGDEVCYKVDRWTTMIVKVTERTKSGRICTHNTLQFNSDGSCRGAFYCKLYPVTQKIRDKIELHRLCRLLHNVVWSELSVDQLRRIVSITEE